MKAKTRLVLVIGIVLSSFGCQSAKPQRREPIAILQRTSTLYLASGPYERIHVEIDVVEGAEPPQDAIDELVAFLETHCRKPVTVLRSDVIEPEEAAGLDPEAVALQHIDGPPEGTEAEPAFMYILFYRGRVKRGVAGKVIAPYACAVYINMEVFRGGWFMRGSRRSLLSPMLRHEAGHILGLCSGKDHGDGEDHGDGMHCYDPDCLMRAKYTVSFTRALFGMDQRIPSELCEECLGELEEKRAHAADPGLLFHGPALVRQEDGYYVALVPKVVAVGFGEPGAYAACQHVAEALEEMERLRTQTPDKVAVVLASPHGFLAIRIGDPRSPQLFAARKDALERAAEDTNDAVADMAIHILEIGQAQPGLPGTDTEGTEWIILPDQPAEDGGDGE